MKPVNEIYSEFLLCNIKFHLTEHTDLFREALTCHMDSKYNASAVLSAVLYEMIFTTRLIRETANPANFVPSKENVNQQFENLFNRINEVENVEKISFREITTQLCDAKIITHEDKCDYYTFYKEIRNPVVHGLTLRLFKPMLGRAPKHAFDTDANYNAIYHKASEALIAQIYKLMPKLLKQ